MATTTLKLEKMVKPVIAGVAAGPFLMAASGVLPALRKVWGSNTQNMLVVGAAGALFGYFAGGKQTEGAVVGSIAAIAGLKAGILYPRWG